MSSKINVMSSYPHKVKATKDQAKSFDSDCINHRREPLERKFDTSFCAFWTFLGMNVFPTNFLLGNCVSYAKFHTRL